MIGYQCRACGHVSHNALPTIALAAYRAHKRDEHPNRMVPLPARC